MWGKPSAIGRGIPDKGPSLAESNFLAKLVRDTMKHGDSWGKVDLRSFVLFLFYFGALVLLVRL